jgi:hypothetical protein
VVHSISRKSAPFKHVETGGCRIELSGDLRMGVQVVPNIKPDREATPFFLETDLSLSAHVTRRL